MKLQTLIEELERQKPLKWDKRINSSQLEMVLSENQVGLQMNGNNRFSITKPCHSQIAERFGIPTRYYHKMESESPELLTRNVNTWINKAEKDFFIRGLDVYVRALLSDRYKVMDHLDILYCSLNELQAHDAEIEDCYLSDTEVNVKVKSNRLRDFVRHKDDLLIGGFLLTNSETGHKALRLEPRLFRVQCSNGMVIEEFKTRQVHLGNGDDGFDEMVYLSIRKSISELFGRFGNIIQTLRETTEIKINNPQRVINNVVEHYRLSETQKENILMAFGAESEYDKYGIANAVTRAAQMEENWENCLELERVGGKLITLPREKFKHLDK
jgi:hypothetical protein